MDASNELARRLQRLERSNLRWKAAAIVTTLAAVALLALLTVEGRSAPPAKGESERVQVDSRSASTNYANFCRVTGTPEEVIFEFGMNSEPYESAIQQWILLVQAGGAFDFWIESGEDIYSLEDGEPI